MAGALARTFDSLQVRNYRLFFSGQVISWTGTWVQWMAQGWLVLEITQSGFGLGLVTAVQWLPILMFGAWAGVLADRYEKRKVLIFTNVTSGVLSLVLGLITVAGIVELWHVVVIALLLGLATALDNPTRQTFTFEMVGRERLTNAVSLNTATFTTARVIGPVVAGFLIEGVGIGQCFLLNAFTFIPVTMALVRMDISELRPSGKVAGKPGQIREGFRYVLSVPTLKTVMAIMAFVGMLQYNFQVILPLLAKETFDGGAATLGLIGAALGVGMFVGSLTTAAFGRPTRKVLLTAGFSLGGLTLLVAVAPTLWIATLLLIPLGASSMGFLATMNTTLQLNSSDAMRGRVMALYFVLFLGTTPIGAPIIGWIAETITPRAALAVGGITTLLSCTYGYLRLPHVNEDAPREVEQDLRLEAVTKGS